MAFSKRRAACTISSSPAVWPRRIVDQPEAIDVDEHDGEPLALARAHVAQRAIEPIHEVAPIGQAGERVVIARVLEALLQVLRASISPRQPLR